MGTINLYTATAGELQSLPGVGLVGSASIIQLRQERRLTYRRLAKSTRVTEEQWMEWHHARRIAFHATSSTPPMSSGEPQMSGSQSVPNSAIPHSRLPPAPHSTGHSPITSNGLHGDELSRRALSLTHEGERRQQLATQMVSARVSSQEQLIHQQGQELQELRDHMRRMDQMLLHRSFSASSGSSRSSGRSHRSRRSIVESEISEAEEVIDTAFRRLSMVPDPEEQLPNALVVEQDDLFRPQDALPTGGPTNDPLPAYFDSMWPEEMPIGHVTSVGEQALNDPLGLPEAPVTLDRPADSSSLQPPEGMPEVLSKIAERIPTDFVYRPILPNVGDQAAHGKEAADDSAAPVVPPRAVTGADGFSNFDSVGMKPLQLRAPRKMVINPRVTPDYAGPANLGDNVTGPPDLSARNVKEPATLDIRPMTSNLPLWRRTMQPSSYGPTGPPTARPPMESSRPPSKQPAPAPTQRRTGPSPSYVRSRPSNMAPHAPLATVYQTPTSRPRQDREGQNLYPPPEYPTVSHAAKGGAYSDGPVRPHLPDPSLLNVHRAASLRHPGLGGFAAYTGVRGPQPSAAVPMEPYMGHSFPASQRYAFDDRRQVSEDSDISSDQQDSAFDPDVVHRRQRPGRWVGEPDFAARRRPRNEPTMGYRAKPPSPRLPHFNGTVGGWDTFDYQFQNVAHVYEWREEEKLQMMTSVLDAKVIDFVRTLPAIIQGNYQQLRRRLRDRYAGSERPEILRKELYDVKQRIDEPIEEFADRIQTMANTAYQMAPVEVIDMMGTEAFIRGVRDRNAALETAKGHPTTIPEALTELKNHMALVKAVMGGSKQSPLTVRQVSFKEESPVRPPPMRPPRPTQSIGVQVDLIADAKSSPRTGSRSPQRRPRPSHDRCYYCDQPGHIRANCPLLHPKATGQE